MATINLRELYPFYQNDFMVEVSNELMGELKAWEQTERAYQRKRERYRAWFSLDRNDGLEHSIVDRSISPDVAYERKLISDQLYTTLFSLPDKQARRIYAHVVEGIRQIDIAHAEGVSSKAVSYSIKRGLRRMKQIMKNF